MKKIIMALVAVFFFVQQSFSQDFPLVYDNPGAPKDAICLIWGDASCLKEKDKVFSVMVDFDEATVVDFDNKFNIEKTLGSVADFNEDHGEDYVRDWPQNCFSLEKSLCDRMTALFKPKFTCTEDPRNADYLFYVKVGLFDFGHFVFVGSFKDGGTITKGLVEIYDVKTESCVAVLDINYLRGRNIGYGNNDRFRQYGVEFSKAMKAVLK